MKKAVFLDRDGVINVDSGYVYKKEDFIFIDGVFKTLKFYQDKGYLLFIITNQSGINRGYFTFDQYMYLCGYILDEFKKNDIFISKIYHCPHAPSERCACRKPSPYMIKQAQKEFNIDLSNSILIGDKISDMQAGLNAKVGKLFLLGTQKDEYFINIKNIEQSIKFI